MLNAALHNSSIPRMDQSLIDGQIPKNTNGE